MEEKPKVYIETSVVSYLVGKPSEILIVAGRQIITNDWWTHQLPKFDPFVSSFVLNEAKEGDQEMAKARMDSMRNFSILEDSEEIPKIAERYLMLTGLPKKCRLDCEHMASASFYSIDYLVSWNCKHIVNAIIIKKIWEANEMMGLSTPMICTPEELYEEEK